MIDMLYECTIFGFEMFDYLLRGVVPVFVLVCLCLNKPGFAALYGR